LAPYWIAKHMKAFTRLKHILLEEPVLRAPKFDSTPFILITDMLKDGFGAVLTQRSTVNLPDGETKITIH
ncbi:hypothetical protein HD554DRAFT_1978789, partial [Boletus coccyginus]